MYKALYNYSIIIISDSYECLYHVSCFVTPTDIFTCEPTLKKLNTKKWRNKSQCFQKNQFQCFDKFCEAFQKGKKTTNDSHLGHSFGPRFSSHKTQKKHVLRRSRGTVGPKWYLIKSFSTRYSWTFRPLRHSTYSTLFLSLIFFYFFFYLFYSPSLSSNTDWQIDSDRLMLMLSNSGRLSYCELYTVCIAHAFIFTIGRHEWVCWPTDLERSSIICQNTDLNTFRRMSPIIDNVLTETINTWLPKPKQEL